jgi:5-amino-6-(5-phosphoribosylamino)uracil reductase
MAHDLADEVQIAIAPIMVGEAKAPRFVDSSNFPAGRMRLVDVQQLGDVAVLRYKPKERRG